MFFFVAVTTTFFQGWRRQLLGCGRRYQHCHPDGEGRPRARRSNPAIACGLYRLDNSSPPLGLVLHQQAIEPIPFVTLLL